MSDLVPPGARTSAATARNREPILAALKPHLPKTGTVLEIAAGAGEHAVYNAKALPHLSWLPTDPAADSLASITAWREHCGLPNLPPPLFLDASNPDSWPIEQADAIVAINMIHISPWSATQGLFQGAGRLLEIGALLFLYGPFLETDIETAPSNLAFDADLRQRNPEWGLRPLDQITALAAQSRFALVQRTAMPANNLALILRRT
jgi:hypothetical protein